MASLTATNASTHRCSTAPTFDSLTTAFAVTPAKHLCTPAQAFASRFVTSLGFRFCSFVRNSPPSSLRVKLHVSNSNFLNPAAYKPAFTTRHVCFGARGADRISPKAVSSTRSTRCATRARRFCVASKATSATANRFSRSRFLNSNALIVSSSLISTPSSGSGGASSSGSGSASASFSLGASPSAASLSSGASAAAIAATIAVCSSRAWSSVARRCAAAASIAVAAAAATKRTQSLSVSGIASPLPPPKVFTESRHSIPATSPVTKTMGTAKNAPARGNPPTKCTFAGGGGASGSVGSSPSLVSNGGPR